MCICMYGLYERFCMCVCVHDYLSTLCGIMQAEEHASMLWTSLKDIEYIRRIFIADSEMEKEYLREKSAQKPPDVSVFPVRKALVRVCFSCAMSCGAFM